MTLSADVIQRIQDTLHLSPKHLAIILAHHQLAVVDEARLPSSFIPHPSGSLASLLKFRLENARAELAQLRAAIPPDAETQKARIRELEKEVRRLRGRETYIRELEKKVTDTQKMLDD